MALLASCAAPATIGFAAKDAVAAGAAWDEVLKSAVTDEGWVKYDKIVGPLAPVFQRVIRGLANASVPEQRAPQMAFFINAYNAICIKTLIDARLPEEVPHAWLFGRNIFSERNYPVAGKKRSLDEIEHEILRAKFNDPRIHAAVAWGASSCPRLRPEAYTAERLSEQLEEECRLWIQSGRTRAGKRKNFLHKNTRTYYASKIFSWYDEDFGGDSAGVLKFIRGYAKTSDREFMTAHKIELKFLEYDWRLNAR